MPDRSWTKILRIIMAIIPDSTYLPARVCKGLQCFPSAPCLPGLIKHVYLGRLGIISGKISTLLKTLPAWD